VTRTPLSRSKVKGQVHQAALLTAVSARQTVAAAGVRTCWPWGNCCYVAVCSAAEGFGAHGGGEGRGHTVAAARRSGE